MPNDPAPGALPPIWKQYVAEEIVISTTSHSLSGPGKHSLKIYAMEVGVVVEKIVLELVPGSVQQSYLGPPESVRKS